MQSDWLEMLAREGTVGSVTLAQPKDMHSSLEQEPDAEPPCPACGHAAPLVNGECSECGLYLGG